jgi:hypothetical protein
VLTTFEAAAVAFVAILPGALFVWGFERVVGRWAIGLSERILRFVGISTVLHALAAPATYLLWRDYFRTTELRETLPLWMWPTVLAYVGLPVLLGSLVARGFQDDEGWAKVVAGSAPAPTAWDALFASDPTGWVLMKLKSGTWIGGAYEKETSYVGGYPEPADIYLASEAVVNQASGDFVRDDAGEIARLDFGVLVRWHEVEYLEVTPVEDLGAASTEERSEAREGGSQDGVQADEDVDDEEGIQGGEGNRGPQTRS